MPSISPRRDVLHLCAVAFGLGTAGCLGDSPNENGFHETTTRDSTTPQSTATHTQSTTFERATIATAEISDTDAKERALTAEEEYLTEQLQNASCLTDWGTSPTTMGERATITKRSADGVYVEVVHPYSYSTEQTAADGGSTALYRVTATSIDRMRGEGFSIPC